jgi:hypothetical protein
MPATINRISQIELISLLIQPNPAIKGAYFATLELLTVPPFKTSAPSHFQDIRNFCIYNIQGNFIYENAVNNQRQREGVDDETSDRWLSMPLPWGNRVTFLGKATPIIEYKGNLYFQCRVIKVTDGHYLSIQNNQEVEYDTLKDYLPKPKEDSGRQGVEKAIQVRRKSIFFLSLHMMVVIKSSKTQQVASSS